MLGAHTTLIPGQREPGLPAGYSLLLCGPTGSGKTTYALQFISEGLDRGEKGIILSTDVGAEEILESATALGYGIAEHQNDLRIVDMFSNKPDNLNEVSIALHEAVVECCRLAPSRIIVDSLSTLAVLLGNDLMAPWVLEQRTRLRRMPIVALFTYDPSIHPEMLKLALQNVLDGTIELQMNESSDGSFTRQFRVFNLRGLSHSTRWLQFAILSRQGIKFADDR